MKSIENLLESRFKKEPSSKMASLAKRAHEGELTTFAGLFNIQELSSQEKESLREALQPFRQRDSDFEEDFSSLLTITSEVKAITHQAALLHGERIAKAQKILKKYRDGAFSTWLKVAYGNRQTPYNLLLFYNFFEQLSPKLREKAETLPRQAIYTLASREGDLEKKVSIITAYSGETKQVVLTKIRELFPLKEKDGRQEDPLSSAEGHLEKAIYLLKKRGSLSTAEKKRIRLLLEEISSIM